MSESSLSTTTATETGLGAGPIAADDGGWYIDLMPDELALARAQMASGLVGLAEAVLVRRVAQLQTQGGAALDELDVARALLAEALWRQGRPIAAGGVAGRIRASSLERRRPLIMVVEAEALAATGQSEAAASLMQRIIDEVGVDEAWRLRGGVASRLPWPVPPSLRARRPAEVAAARRGMEPSGVPTIADPERTAAAHARLEAARLLYGAGDAERGDRELMVALRLDARIAPEGLPLLEPTLEIEAPTERLLLYGDLLRAAGRGPEASAVYDRAARS
ncbi:MAG TPA: hypothetical protein VKU35_01700 [Candidatus Limnocylindria bacterium]|nr:hypothetical protein [Candidatus Limnocylindria bacterium]